MVLKLYPFRFRDAVTRKWVHARYKAEQHEIAARYPPGDWEITGDPELRDVSVGAGFNPLRSMPTQSQSWDANVELATAPALEERFLVSLFLRRYVTWCARTGRFAQMEGARRLYLQVLSE
jgi:hypothetical protein